MYRLLKHKHTIELFLLLFIAFSFIFKVSISTPAILILLIFNFKPAFVSYNKVLHYFTITFLSIFIMYTLSVLFVPKESPSLIVKSLAFIFVPAIFHWKEFTKKEILLFTGSFLIFQIVHIIYIDAIMLKFLFFDSVPDFTQISGIIQDKFIIERPYYALNCLLSIVCLHYISKVYNLKIYIVLIFLLFIVVSLIIAAARLAMGVSLILSIIMLLENKNIKYSLAFIAIIGITTLVAGKYAMERITVMSGEPRVAIWQCAYNIINSPDFNLLTGEFSNKIVDEKLLACYDTKEIAEGDYYWISKYNFKFNTHNQFLGFLTAYGLVGLFLFGWIFILNVFNYFKHKNIFAIYFIIVFCSQALFENILSRQQGIYVFLWFCYLFLILQFTNNKYINE